MKKVLTALVLFCIIVMPIFVSAKTSNLKNVNISRSQTVVFKGTVQAINADGYSVKITDITSHKSFFIDVGKDVAVHVVQSHKNVKSKINNKLKKVGKKNKAIQVGSSVTVKGFLESDVSVNQAQVTLQKNLTKVKQKNKK